MKVTISRHAVERAIERFPALNAPIQAINGILCAIAYRGVRIRSMRFGEQAKITNLQMRDLRRFFASAGLSAGLTLEQVGQLLGHRNTQTTKRYAFLMQDAATRAANEAGEEIRRRAKPTRS